MKTTNILLGVLCVLVAILCFITGYVHSNCGKCKLETADRHNEIGYMENTQNDDPQIVGDGSNNANESGTNSRSSGGSSNDALRYSGGGAANNNGAASSSMKGVGNADAETGTSKIKTTTETPIAPKKKKPGTTGSYTTQPAGTGTSSGRQVN